MKIKLSISEPCHENWEKMSSTEKGRYCNSCHKEVIDLTSCDKNEAANLILKKGPNTCVKIPEHYLENPVDIKAAGWSQNSKLGILGSSIMVMLFTPFIIDKKAEVKLTSPDIKSDKNTETVKANNSIQITGTVLNQQSQTISNASVEFIQGKFKAKGFTTANGRIVLNLDEKKFRKGSVLICVQKEGYELLKKEINITVKNNNLKFILNEVNNTNTESEISELSSKTILLDEAVINQSKYSGDVPTIECFWGGRTYMMGCVSYTELIYEHDLFQDSIFVNKNEETVMVDIEPVFVNELKTYPNPTTDFVNIEMKKEGSYTIYIFTLDGKMVLQENFNANKTQINLSAFERGNYIVKVVDTETNEWFDGKVVLMR